jgi:dephospho-CoA kinase
MGLFLVFPLSILAATLTIRIAAAGWRPSFVRSDVWTTLFITIVGDVFLEILLPSLQCLPMHAHEAAADHHIHSNPFDDLQQQQQSVLQQQQQTSPPHFTLWMLQTWGFHCPATLQREQLLAPDSVGTILTIRLIFMCLGVYLGESFLPVALTGSIATGKSTVAAMLLDPVQVRGGASNGNNNTVGGGPNQSNSSSKTAARKQKKPKSGTAVQQQQQQQSVAAASSSSSQAAASTASLESDEEGSFLIVDTDSIGHEILLPPSVLAGEQDWTEVSSLSSPTTTTAGGGGGGAGGASASASASATTIGSNTADEGKEYTVHPNDSVYYDILSAFGDPDVGNKNILDDNGWIDRRKLGAIIFEDASQRRVLNGITHPRIILIMLKRILHGIFWSSQDIVCADVPLLFESGQLRRLFGITIMVACHPEQQLERLRKRNPDLTEQQCRDRIDSQRSIAEKVAMADVVIWNNGDLNALSEEVERVRRDVMGRIYGVGMSLLQMLLLVGGSLSLAVSSKLFSTWT